ncbi:MAG TPA: hypothetical protein VIZ28_09505 [Chitinophagaceae bacterium]
MKTQRLIIFATVASLLMMTSCQRDSLEETFSPKEDAVTVITEQTGVNAKKGSSSGTCNPDAYVITLESRTQVNGYWEWVWSVYNPNPGNGNNGTAQGLSHWGMQLAGCVNPASVTGGAYSSDGQNWSSFSPSYQPDPSQGCMTTPVIKFDFGTSGSAKSYYKLVVSQDYSEGLVPGYYKSGSNTGCCTFYFTGIGGCGGPVEIEVVE